MSKKDPEKTTEPKKTEGLICCECGFRILLIPDLKMMSRAIEAHAAEHVRKEKDPTIAALEEERINDFLVVQTFNELANYDNSMIEPDELRCKIKKLEEKITILEKELTDFNGYLSSGSGQTLHARVRTDETIGILSSELRERGPTVVLRCKQLEDFQNLARDAKSVAFNYKGEEKIIELSALKGNQLVIYLGTLPKFSLILIKWLSSQLNIPEERILEGSLSLN